MTDAKKKMASVNKDIEEKCQVKYLPKDKLPKEKQLYGYGVLGYEILGIENILNVNGWPLMKTIS